MNGLWVVKAGPQSLLQDDGWRDWQHLSISAGDPLDRQAAAWAGRLLGSPWGTPLLETTFDGLALERRVEAVWLVPTGMHLALTVDSRECLPRSRFRVHRGQHIELGFTEAEQRAYLAYAGDFRVKPVLGSVACQVCDGLGGLQGDGRILAEGGCLLYVETGAAHPWDASVPWRLQPDYRQQRPLCVLFGSDAAALNTTSWRAFFASTWRISPRSDRMGVRLADEPLRGVSHTWSQGVVEGVTQVPPGDRPIMLMADCQSMGGYLLLGFVHPLDFSHPAQSPAHSEVAFVESDLMTQQAGPLRFYRFSHG